ncbi:MAG: adenylate/guanylate cyclase domain-containing protein [Burkholderiales bacterium]
MGIFRSLEAAVVSPNDTADQRLNKTLLVFACALMGFAAIVWLAIYWSMGIKFPVEIPLGYQLLSAASLLLFLKTKNFEFFRATQVTMFLFVPFIMQWSIGSYVSSSGVILWALLAPIGVMLSQGARESIPWFFAYIVLTAMSGFFDFYLATPSEVPLRTVAVFFVLNFAAMSSIVYLLINYSVHEKEKLKRALDDKNLLLVAEQEKSERLLLNVLPSAIAQRLKHDEATIADGFSDVTVMFVDIVNFTTLSEELPPNQVVALLNQVFSQLDALAEKYGVEKIKTIGDAYMVAGGLPGTSQEYTEAMANMALELRDIAGREAPLKNLKFHIGIATGPAVGGVIGKKKFVYDLWGDTINLASRLASEAEVGTIPVDTTTYKRLRRRYQFSGPDSIPLKGKGDINVYLLIAKGEGTVVPLDTHRLVS